MSRSIPSLPRKTIVRGCRDETQRTDVADPFVRRSDVILPRFAPGIDVTTKTLKPEVDINIGGTMAPADPAVYRF